MVPVLYIRGASCAFHTTVHQHSEPMSNPIVRSLIAKNTQTLNDQSKFEIQIFFRCLNLFVVRLSCHVRFRRPSKFKTSAMKSERPLLTLCLRRLRKPQQPLISIPFHATDQVTTRTNEHLGTISKIPHIASPTLALLRPP